MKKLIKKIWWKLFREKAYYKKYAEQASPSLQIYYKICEENGLLEEFWKKVKEAEGMES